MSEDRRLIRVRQYLGEKHDHFTDEQILAALKLSKYPDLAAQRLIREADHSGTREEGSDG